jgi:hypothetical protein
LRDDVPFVTIVARSQVELSGEASPDATVTLENEGKCVVAERKGNEWSVKWPADFEKKGAKLVARRGEKAKEVDLAG